MLKFRCWHCPQEVGKTGYATVATCTSMALALDHEMLTSNLDFGQLMHACLALLLGGKSIISVRKCF